MSRCSLVQIKKLVTFVPTHLGRPRSDLLGEFLKLMPAAFMVPNELVDRGDAPTVVAVTSADGYGGGSIITPEAVLLDFELAGVGSRAIAYSIDLIVQIGALMGLLTVASAIAIGSEVAALITMLVALILVVLGYPTLLETFNGGRTLGRMVVSTRVVTVEGSPVRFRQAFVRALLGIVDLLATAGGVAVVSSLLTRRGQRLGDLVAGTMVLREPSPTGPTGSIVFYPPPYLAGWSQTVDTRPLGNDAYQLVRDFVTREDLTDGAKQMVGEDLAALVSERLPHAAKTPAVPAIDYLTAIATATQATAGRMSPPPPAPTRRPPAQPFGTPAPQAAPAPTAPAQPAAVQPAPAPAPNDGGFAAPG